MSTLCDLRQLGYLGIAIGRFGVETHGYDMYENSDRYENSGNRNTRIVLAENLV